MPSTKAQTQQVTDGPGGVALIEVPAELPPKLPQPVVLFIRFLYAEGFHPRVDWFRRVRRGLVRIIFGESTPTDAFGEIFVNVATGQVRRGTLYFGRKETRFMSVITAGDILSDWLAERHQQEREIGIRPPRDGGILGPPTYTVDEPNGHRMHIQPREIRPGDCIQLHSHRGLGSFAWVAVRGNTKTRTMRGTTVYHVVFEPNRVQQYADCLPRRRVTIIRPPKPAAGQDQAS